MPLSFAKIVLALLGCCCVWVPWAKANVKLPSLFSDNMVLQAGAKDAVWGTAEPGERVTVTMGRTQVVTMADNSGHWKVEIGPLAVGGPLVMTVAGKNTILIHNVAVGQVWLCSGQSNMTFSVGPQMNSWETGVNHYKEEIASAHYPMIRMFTVSQTVAGRPQTGVGGRWEITSPVTVARFSAVGYFFGLNLFKSMREPIGLIHSSWGGTPAESWTPLPVLHSDPVFVGILERWRREIAAYPAAVAHYNEAFHEWEQAIPQADTAGNPLPPAPPLPRPPARVPWRPAGLFNGMIAPLIPYRIKGVIWYQGEANADRAIQYRTLFPDLIRAWRSAWEEGDFPFLFVQLASFQDVLPPRSYPLLREAQLMTLSLPKTAMVVAIDIGDAASVHPRDKQEIGRRLALAARAVAYGEKVIYSGPVYSSMDIEGSKIRLHFAHLGGGLIAPGGATTYLEGFQVAGADHKFYSAQAMVQGDTVVVESRFVERPIAVRYAWQNYPICNLYNEAGLPASPFRTDNWQQ